MFDIYDKVIEKQRLLQIPFGREDDFLGEVWESVEGYIVREVFESTPNDRHNEWFFEYYSGNIPREHLIDILIKLKNGIEVKAPYEPQ